MAITFPLLGPDDIEVKVKQVTKQGVVALLYKTARVDMELLDAVVGPENWTSEYQEIKGNLYCGISVYTDHGWVTKWDCGIESRADGDGNEKKGEASDAFKRAGFKWGIGRELYSSPFTFLKVPVEPDGNRFKMKDPWQRFSVSEISYDERRKINRLVIVDEKTRKTVYSYGNDAPPAQASQTEEKREEKCEDCGNLINSVMLQNGEKFPAAMIAKGSKEKFGRVLCYHCSCMAAKAAKAAS